MIRRWIFVRDGRLSGRTKLALVALAVAALLLLFPLRLALGWAGAPAVSASGVAGSVWDGRIDDLRLASVPLGTVNAGLRPLPLLLGRREIALQRPGPTGLPEFFAIIAGGSDWFAVRRVSGHVPLGEGFATIPAAGLAFREFAMEAAGGRCRKADGQVTLMLAPMSELMPAPVALSGRARCDKGALYVPMVGPSGSERLFLRIEPNGRWRAELILSGLPVAVTAPLLEMGFSGRPGGIGMTASGRL